MRRELEAVYDELKRRLRAGENSVYLREDTVRSLKEYAQQEIMAPPAPEISEPVAEAPPKKVVKAPKIAVPSSPEFELGEGSEAQRLEALRERVLSDAWCLSQVKEGKKVVFGVGNPVAKIFFCGEAPGAEEEIRGEPFVGPAGQLLTKIIKAMGLDRNDVYIANIMNYRPPMPGSVGNRPPTEAEMAYCLPFLIAQMEIVQPDIVVALGKTAVDGLLGRDTKRRMTKIRGQWVEFKGIPLLPTFHPSYLLRNQSMKTKRLVWEDMLTVMERLGMPVSEKQKGYFL